MPCGQLHAATVGSHFTPSVQMSRAPDSPLLCHLFFHLRARPNLSLNDTFISHERVTDAADKRNRSPTYTLSAVEPIGHKLFGLASGVRSILVSSIDRLH